jgi:hypothetical protein
MFEGFFKKMVDQGTFTAGPYAAIWIGNHTSEDQLENYLDSGRFSKEYRFRLDDQMMPEVAAESSAKPLRELVQGFSRYEKFQDEFVARATELGISEASSIIVFHFIAYSPDGLPIAKNPEMRFVGNFWFEGF